MRIITEEQKQKYYAKNKEWREKHKEEKRIYMQKWHADNRKRDLTKDRLNWVQRMYGISKEDYIAMENEQQGSCYICGMANSNGRKLSLDHDHTTGKVRRLICHKCNVILGMSEDDISRLSLCIEYLDEFSGGMNE